MTRKALYVGRTHPSKANKHPGIYNAQKDIAPTPKNIYIHTNLPKEYVCALQSLYPELTLYKALRQYIVDNLKPVDLRG